MFYCFSGYLKKHGKTCWSSRSFRKERALRKAANLPGQTRLKNYFETLADLIDNNENTRIPINSIIGADKTSSVKPILRKMLENAEQNGSKKSAKGFRHDDVIRKFASSLYCLNGKAGYEMLQKNLVSALPSVVTINRNIGSQKKIKEGEFRFNELADHLREWGHHLVFIFS